MKRFVTAAIAAAMWAGVLPAAQEAATRSAPDRMTASASTSDHHPMPRQPTLTGSNAI